MRKLLISILFALIAYCITLTSSNATAAALIQPSYSLNPNAGDYFATGTGQEKKDKEVKVSDDERKWAKKIEEAKDATAKVQLSTDFIKKHPKSSLRSKISSYVVDQVLSASDPAQKITLLEQLQSQFTNADEAQYITPSLINLFIFTKRYDDAFRAGASWIEKNPEDVSVQTMLALHGTSEAQRQNPKFLQQAQQYGLNAIGLIEANKKPANMDDAQWQQNKTNWPPQLYQAMGIASFFSGDLTDSESNLKKAVELNPKDPFTYFFLGGVKNEQYQATAKKYQATPSGPQQDVLLKNANALIDEVIDYYARTIAPPEGKTEYQQMTDQLKKDLETYYKFRHNNSTEGMQQLIDKYKTPAATTP